MEQMFDLSIIYPKEGMLAPEALCRGYRKHLQRKKKKDTPKGVSFCGSGRRIRTLTYGVRVRCATFTQSRCVLTNKIYYTDFRRFVNTFFVSSRFF